MLFKRPKTEPRAVAFPGHQRALDGRAAILAVESMACDVLVVESSPEFGPPAGTRVHAVRDAAAATARVAGESAAGARAAALVTRLDAVVPSLRATAGGHLACVFHATCPGAFHGGHDDLAGAADAGLFQLFARDAQEAADFALVAHRAAELSLTPGICAVDLYRTSRSVQSLQLPEPALVDRYLGRPDDVVDTPTASQRVLFGARRRLVPRMIDPDRPAGIGGIQDAEVQLKAAAAQRAYFGAHVREMIERAFAEFGDLTGRRYGEATGYRVEDADVVVVAQGAVVDELEGVVDYVREREKIRAGVVNLSVFRPFPGAAVTRMLAGKRVVTVLERGDRPLADSPPITLEVRAAIDRASENGAFGRAVHTGFDSYRPGERARVVTGVYGVGAELPSFAELVAVFRNMTDPSPKTTYYVGLGEDPAIRRFPHLQTMQQALNREYPERGAAMLPAASDVAAPAATGRAVEVYTLSSQGAIFAGNLFAEALCDDAGYGVRTFPRGGLEPSVETATFTMAHAEGASAPRVKPSLVDTALVSGGKLVEDVSSRRRLAAGGTLVVESNRDAAGTWNALSRRTARWVQDNAIRVRIIDAARIASETASQPSFVDQLAVWALLGAYAAAELPGDRIDAVVAGLAERLTWLFGAGHYLVADVTSAVRRGAAEVADVDYSAYGTEALAAASDGEAPWTVQDAVRWDDTVFDATRFWHSVGYLYDSGQSDWVLSDPHLAAGVMPARSSAFRDLSPYRLRMPEWLPENCTGCGACWAQCPDSALPPTIQSIETLIGSAMSLAERSGGAMIQMKRFSGHIAKQAYRLFAGDGMHRYVRMGALLDDAFSQLVDKLGLDGEKRAVMEDEFARVRSRLEHYPVAKTETFFTAPHEARKGDGALLSIALNPLACTGCGVCIDVCPEDALAWATQTTERLDAARDHWKLQLALPDVPADSIGRFVSSDPATDVHRLLDRDAYHTLVGGDGSYPGNSAKTAVHLVAAAAESVMKPRFAAHVARLDTLVGKLERKIQGDVSDALRINDFDEFSRRLDRLEKGILTPAALAATLGRDEAQNAIDPDRLRRLMSLHEALREQRRLYTEGAGGRGRSRLVMAIDSEGVRLWSGTYPYNPLPYPWACHVPGHALELAAGVHDGIARRLAGELAVCRAADLELADAYDPAVHDPVFGVFGARDLDDDERRLVPPVIVLGEVGATRWEDVGALLSGRAAIQLVLIDPVGVSLDATAGAPFGANLLSLARSNPAAHVVQASVGWPGHLMRSVAESVERGGPALFHVFAPDPLACGIAPEKTATQARFAVETRAFPMFTATGSRVSIEGNPAPERAWPERTLTFQEPSGVESSLEAAATVADWAIREARFQKHFTIVPKGRLHDRMRPLSEFLETDAGAREGVEPFVRFAGKGQRHVLAVVGPEMVRAAEAARDFWRLLQSSETAEAVFAAKPGAVAAEPAASAPGAPSADGAALHQALTERLLALCGFSADPDFFKRSLREFVVDRRVETSHGETGDDASHS